ncbi:hypothetical protein LT85_4751 [Collimonas arenae]|uniref:Uncharacterized protein n=1 Tax=Collimonas arenae TaxID=279058 RepID=A0A0A1FJR7_9BURK|nr:hypothetical protein LT85_4751 [Collimonas arenae]
MGLEFGAFIEVRQYTLSYHDVGIESEMLWPYGVLSLVLVRLVSFWS